MAGKKFQCLQITYSCILIVCGSFILGNSSLIIFSVSIHGQAWTWLWVMSRTDGMNGIDSESSSSFTHDKCVWTPSTCRFPHSSLLCRSAKDICLWHFTSRSISLHAQICHDLLHAVKAVLWMAGWFGGHCACYFLGEFSSIFVEMDFWIIDPFIMSVHEIWLIFSTF